MENPIQLDDLGVPLFLETPIGFFVAFFSVNCLEDHPRTCKWLGSPPFISHEKAIWKGNNPI